MRKMSLKKINKQRDAKGRTSQTSREAALVYLVSERSAV